MGPLGWDVGSPGAGVAVLVLTPMQCLAQASVLVCAVAIEMFGVEASLCQP